MPFSWLKNEVRIAAFTLLMVSFYSTPSHAIPPIPVGPAFDYACNKKFWGLSTAYYKTMGFKDRVVDTAFRIPNEVPLYVWSRLREESTDEMVEYFRRHARERRDVWKERAPKISQYMKELGQSWGLRVLFKEAKPPDHLALGFLTPWRPEVTKWYHHFQLANPMFWVQLMPRVATKMATGTPHSVTPLRGIFNTAFQVPVRATTGKLLGKAYELTLPLHFLFDGVVYYHVYQVADDIYEELKKDKLENSVEENGPAYDEIIEYDIRFASIKNDLANTAKTGITRAWILDDHGDLAQIEKSPAAAGRLADLKQDGFITFLTGLKENGTLTQNQFLREVQMNIEWQGRFAASDVFQMKPINQNAAEENTPLDLTDTQLDTVERLGRQAP